MAWTASHFSRAVAFGVFAAPWGDGKLAVVARSARAVIAGAV
jgi:hypothetical protein